MPDAAELIRQLKSKYPDDYGSLSDQDILGRLHKANPTKFSAYTLTPPTEEPSDLLGLKPLYYGAKKGLGKAMSAVALGIASAESLAETDPQVASEKRKWMLEEAPLLSDLYKKGKDVSTTPELKPYESGTAQFLLRDIPELVGNMAPALAMGPIAAGAYFMGQGAVNEYERSLAEGRPESQAFKDAMWGGATSAASAIPFTKAGTVAAKGISTGIQKVIPSLGEKVIPYLGKGLATTAEMSGINMAQYAAQQSLTGREINTEELKDVGKMGLVGWAIGPMHLKMQRMGLKKAIKVNEDIINDSSTNYDQKLTAYKNNRKLNEDLWSTRVGKDQTEYVPPERHESIPELNKVVIEEPLTEDTPFFTKKSDQPIVVEPVTNSDMIREHVKKHYPKSHQSIEVLSSEEAIAKYGSKNNEKLNEQIRESTGFFLPKRGKIGNIVIVSDNVNNWSNYTKNNGQGKYGNWTELVDEAVKHELTHMGIRNTFETMKIPFDTAMRKIYGMALSDNEFMPKSYKKEANSNPLLYVEEWMNFKYGSDPKSPLLQRAVSYVRTVLRRYFPNMEWSDNDIRYMVQRAQSKAQQMTAEYPGGGSSDLPKFMAKDIPERTPEEQAKHDLLEDNINRRWVGLPEAKQEMLDYIQSAGKDLVEDTLRILHDEDIQAAATHVDVDAVLKGHRKSDSIGHAETVALESEFVKLSQKTQEATDPKAKEDFGKRMRSIASVLISSRSQAGRTLRHQSLQVKDMLVELISGNKPDVFQRSSYDNLNRTVDILAKRTGKEKAQIYNELLNIPDKFDRFEYIKKQMKSNKIEYGKDIFKWYIYNNILSGLNAHLRNTASTSIHILQGAAARPYTVLLNNLAGSDLATSKELGMAGAKTVATGYARGWKEGWKQAKEIWKWGMSESQIDYLGIPTEPFEGKALNAISRALTAEDAVMRNMAFGEHLYTWAFNQAVKDKINVNDGKALATHMQKSIENIPKDIKEQLYHQSDRDVFRNEPGDVGQKIEALRNATGIYGTMIMPFFRTVSNVTKAVLENTFLGFAFKDQRAVSKAIFNHLTKGIKAGDSINREQLDAMARTLLGVTGISIIGAMYRSGAIDMTGPIPSDPEEARIFWSQGKQPNSILIPGKGWVEYQYLGTLGPALSMAKSFIDNWTRGNSDKPERFVLPFIDTMRAISDTGFLSGLANLQELIGNPKYTISKYAAAQLGMITPLSGVQRYLANKDFFKDIPEISKWTGDPIIRDANTMAERYVESTPMVWPFKHPQSIPPMIDISGNFLTRADTTDFGATKLKPELKDPVSSELVRLKQLGEEKIPISAYEPSGKIPEAARPYFGGREDYTPEERFALSQAVTEGVYNEFSRVMSLPQYQTLSDEQKAEVIRKVKSRTTNDIKRLVIPQMIDRLRSLEPIPTSARTQ